MISNENAAPGINGNGGNRDSQQHDTGQQVLRRGPRYLERRVNVVEGRVVAGMYAFVSVRERVRPLGEGLFECEFMRELAAHALGFPIRSDYSASLEFKAAAGDVVLFMDSTDEAWALDLLRLLVRRRKLPVLCQTLRWGADALEDGQPFRHVIRQISWATRRARLGREAA